MYSQTTKKPLRLHLRPFSDRSTALRCARLLCYAVIWLASACAPDRGDDAFARAFIENLRTGNIAGAAQLEPDSEISAAGWQVVRQQAVSFPPGLPDSIRLREWETLRDEHGRANKLTYQFHAGGQSSLVEIWIVRKNGHRFVNTVRTTAPAPQQ